MTQMSNRSSKMLWIFYLALLAVLPPYTAWAFARFESPAVGWLGVSWGIVTAWAATFAFEAAIAALTHKLAGRIMTTPRYTAGRVLLRRLSYQYLNAYAAGLFVALGVSALANFAHAVEMVESLPSLAITVSRLFSIPSRSVAFCRLCHFSLPGFWAILPPLKPH